MHENSMTFALIVPAAYFLGSIPFGLILTRMFGAGDVRESGSGNIGATNVARTAGLLPGILTLLLDGAKGAASVWGAAVLTHDDATWMILAGLAALLGHCFPVWLKFDGGKGVATAAGVFLVLCPSAFVGAIILFVLVTGFWHYVSLGSISAAATAPLLVYLLWAPGHAPPLMITFGSLAAAVLVIARHGANLQRLLQGTEPRFTVGKKKDEA